MRIQSTDLPKEETVFQIRQPEKLNLRRDLNKIKRQPRNYQNKEICRQKKQEERRPKVGNKLETFNYW